MLRAMIENNCLKRKVLERFPRSVLRKIAVDNSVQRGRGKSETIAFLVDADVLDVTVEISARSQGQQ